MKKLLVAAALLGSAFMAQAEESFAPEAGDFSTEIQFTPFKSDGTSFSMTAFQGRYFWTDKDAVLFEIGLGGTNKKNVPDTDGDAFTRNYNGRFMINVGYQRHFYNYKRISLYAGAKVGYIHDFAGSKNQINDDNWSWNNEGTGNGFNAYLTTGIDFYVYKGLYLGAEINLGMTDVIATNTTYKNCVAGHETESKTKVGGHDFSGGFDCNPRLRLGWTF